MPFRIAGEYIDENGDPIEGAIVIANVRSDGSVAGVTTTDALGEWAIDPLPTDAEMLYVSVFQDGFVPQIFDQIEPEEVSFDFFRLLLESGDSILTEAGDFVSLED